MVQKSLLIIYVLIGSTLLHTVSASSATEGDPKANTGFFSKIVLKAKNHLFTTLHTRAGQPAPPSLRVDFSTNEWLPPSGRVTSGLLALYDFSEGAGNTVTDVSGTGSPLNLTIQDPTNTYWLSGGGLIVNSPTLIKSSAPASKIIDAVKATNEITVEAWVKPANTSQDGPARIVSLSTDTGNRNFTLGQENNKYAFRYRTSDSGNNGTPNIEANGLSAAIQHIVYTKNSNGTVKGYINGSLVVTGSKEGSNNNWNDNYLFALANELTNDRDWLGEFYLVAVYDRELSSAEVTQNYGKGYCSGSAACATLTCNEGNQIDLIYKGINNNIPVTLYVDEPSNVDKVEVEIVYKGGNPGSSITVEDDEGTHYTAYRQSVGSGAYVYLVTIPRATSYVRYTNDNNENRAQSIVLYAYRSNVPGQFMLSQVALLGGYKVTETMTFFIPQGEAPRDITVKLPVSEVTLDNRVLNFSASAGGVTKSFTRGWGSNWPSLPNGCCIDIVEILLEDVPAAATTLTVEVESPNSNGQSFVVAGTITVDIECSCPDFSAPVNYTPDNPINGQAVQFSTTAVTEIEDETYVWNFGENATPATATGMGPHAVLYSESGTNNITLSVANEFCENIVQKAVIIGGGELCDNGLDDDGDGLIDNADPDCPTSEYELETILPGAYVIDMGVNPQTVENGLKPYGLIFELLENYNVPIKWIINSNKEKDGVDFYLDGQPMRGGPFVIPAEYRTPQVNALIDDWEAMGVVGHELSYEIAVPVYATLNYSLRWTLDAENGKIAEEYLELACIPEYAYNWNDPATLNCCTNIYVMPHAEPEWETHGHLLTWNAPVDEGGCAGIIWAGCKAVSELENIEDPADPSQKLNFLMQTPDDEAATPAVWAKDHGKGTIPPPYKYGYLAHPIMQFMGLIDGASESGAEQIYFPTKGWRPSTYIGMWDEDHPDIPSVSPGPAAKIAFGKGFGQDKRGMVMYSAGHSHEGNDPENIAAMRTFFNFSLLASDLKSIQIDASIPSTINSGETVNLSVTPTGGTGVFSFQWENTCAGSFSNDLAAQTAYTAPIVTEPTTCQLKIMVTDNCGTRKSFEIRPITIIPASGPPKAVNDTVNASPGSTVNIPILANDSDPNLDPLTPALIGNTNTGNGVFSLNNNKTVAYTSAYDFIGSDQIDYQICDTTAVAEGGPFCDTATIFVDVSWLDENGCLRTEFWGVEHYNFAQSASKISGDVENASNASGAADGNYAKLKGGGGGGLLQIGIGTNLEKGDTLFIKISGKKKESAATISASSDGSNFAYPLAWTSSATSDPGDTPDVWDTLAYVVKHNAGINKVRIHRQDEDVFVDAAFYGVYACVPALPAAVNDTAVTFEDIAITYAVQTNDSDPQQKPLTTFIVSQPENGSAVVTENNEIKYLPNPEFVGQDSLVYKICNDLDLCDNATFYLDILSDWCPSGKRLIPFDTTAKYAAAITAENSVSNESEALGQPLLVSDSDDYYAKFDKDDDYLVLDLQDTVLIGDTIWLYIGSDNDKTARLQVSATFNSTHYASGSGFFDTQYYSTNKELDDDNPQQDIVPFIVSSDWVRYLRFQRQPGQEKPGVNGLTFTKIHRTCSDFPSMAARNDFVTIYKGENKAIGVLANDEGGAVPLDPNSLTMTGLDQPANGTIDEINGASGTITFTPETYFTGKDTFQYRICNQNNVCKNAWVYVSVICPPATDDNYLAGDIYFDKNNDGYYATTESGAENVKVLLYKDLDEDGIVDGSDEFMDSTRTDVSGNYQFYFELSPTSTGAMSQRINGSYDDAEESVVCNGCNKYAGYVYRTSSDLEMTRDGSYNGEEQLVGMRFNNIAIPDGAVITNATIEFTAYGCSDYNDCGSPTDLIIRAEASDDASPISSSDFNVSGRTMISESVQWQNIPAWNSGYTYKTPNLASLVQQITERPGWESGNSILFTIGGDGKRKAYSHDGSRDKAALLEIEYEVPGSGQFIAVLEPQSLPTGASVIGSSYRQIYLMGANAASCSVNFPLAQNSPPIAMPDTAYIPYSTSKVINVVANDSDPDGDNLTASLNLTATHGTVTNFQNGSFQYKHTNLSFSGVDYFSYIICDDGIPSLCDTTTVVVIIENFQNNPPVGVPDYDTIAINQESNIFVDENDYDPEGHDLNCALLPGLLQPANGTLSINSYNRVIYTPQNNFTGRDSFEYQVCDDVDSPLCDTAKVFIYIINQAPIARNDVASTFLNTFVNVEVLANDREPDDGILVLVSAGTNGTGGNSAHGGTVTINDNNTAADFSDDFVEYSPQNGFSGADTFQYILRDDQSPHLFDTAFVFVTVTTQIDLEITKSVNPLSADYNDEITFTIQLHNNGPGTATGVKVRDLLPSGLSFLSTNRPTTYDPVSGIWNVGTLLSGASISLQITATIIDFNNIKNIAQVVQANEADIDSTPDNDDGDQSEDDEDNSSPIPIDAALDNNYCEEPLIENSNTTVSYAGMTNVFSVSGGSAIIDTIDTPMSIFISNSQLNLSAEIQETGMPLSGTLILQGDVFGLTDTLLTAELSDFGFNSSGGNPFQFEFLITGGALSQRYGNTGDTLAIIITGVNNFPNSWENSWDGGSAALVKIAPKHCKLTGHVRFDTDTDGDANDNDSPLSGVTLQLKADGNCNGTASQTIATTTTTTDGEFTFYSVPEGCYVLQETDPVSHISTYDSEGANDNTIALEMSSTPKIASTGHVFLDGVDCVVNNSGFESDFQNWTTSGNVNITSDAYAGSKAAEIVGDNASFWQKFPITPDSVYTLRAYVHVNESPEYAEIGLAWKDASNNTISEILQPVYGLTYKVVELSGKAPAGATQIEVWAYKEGSNSETLVVDEFCLSFGADMGGNDWDITCGCTENLLPNGGFEIHEDGTAFNQSLEGSDCAALSNGSDNILTWSTGISSQKMYYIEDMMEEVNNPQGEYFIWLPAGNDCFFSDANFSTNLNLEDGEEYQICFYAASWNAALDGNGYPTGQTVSQNSGTLNLEFDYANTGFQTVEAFAVPASQDWSSLNWKKFTFRFIYSDLNPVQTFFFTNARNASGVAIDAVSLSKVDCYDFRPNCPTGTLRAESWIELNGTSLKNLYAETDFPNNPDVTYAISSYQGFVNVADNYGTRVRGYIHPPETGLYYFTLTADDDAKFWLSTDESPQNLVELASINGWTQISQFDKYPTQQSSAIYLEAGQVYYTELIHKEGGGGDHFQVYWQTPSNNTRTIIPGQYLSPICYPEICDNGLDDDQDGLVDCNDPDCNTLGYTYSVTAGSCGGGGMDGSINLIPVGDQPFSYLWSDMEPTARYTYEKSADDVQNDNDPHSVEGYTLYSNESVQGHHSLYLDGNTYIRYSQDGNFMEIRFNELSFAAWLKPANLTGIKTIYEEGGGTNGISMRLNDNTLEAAVRNGGKQFNAGTLTFPNDGQWHHVAFVFDNGEFTLYLDGVAGTTTTASYSSVNNHSGNGGIGELDGGSGFGGGSGQNYIGLIDDVRYFYNKALNPYQVSDLAAGANRTALLVGDYDMTIANVHGCTQSETINIPTGTNLDDPGTIAGDEEVCINSNAGAITSASLPQGESETTFEYRWERSVNSGATWAVIPGATQSHFDPGMISVTTNYRRATKSINCNTWIYSNIVTKTIINNIDDPGEISGNEEYCGSYDPNDITSISEPTGGQGGTIEYQWQYSYDGVNWTNILTGKGETFDPGTITQSTYFRRAARRNPCSDWIYSNTALKTIVFNYTDAGTISGNETSCGSFDAASITSVSTPSGGSEGDQQYQWQKSTDGGSTWSTITGAITSTYNPGTITQTTQYRRRTRRAPCNAWLNSNTITKTVYRVPNAQISQAPNGTLCEQTDYVFEAFDDGTDITYTWNFGSYASIQNPTGKGPHTIQFDVPNSAPLTTVPVVLILTENGCVAKDTIEIDLRPEIVVSDISANNPTDCTSPNGSINVTASNPSGTAIQVSIDGGSTWGADDFTNFTGLDAGVYNIRVRYSGGECIQNQGGINISDPIQPNANILGTYTEYCVNTNIVFEAESATGSSTYTWNFGENATPATATGIGPHTVSYGQSGMKTATLTVSRNGCDNTDQKTFTVVGNFTSGGSISGDEIMCSTNDPAIITGSGSPTGGFGGTHQYQWQSRGTNGLGGWGAWQDIFGANAADYDPAFIFSNTQYRRKERRSPCGGWVYSNAITKQLYQRPFAVDDLYETACPGQILFDNVSPNDLTLVGQTYSLHTPPANAVVDIDADGEITFIPNSFYCGSESFVYKICNEGEVCCDTARVTINLNDQTPPELFNIPDDVIVHCDELIPLPPSVLALENCLSVSLGLDEISTQGIDNCSLYDYILTRTWTAVDYCGNSTSASQRITVQDVTAPDIYRVYSLPNGKKMVGGVMENVTDRWKLIRLPIQFATKPVILAQATSQNEFTPAKVRIRNVSTTQFEIKIEEEEGNDNKHLEELVSWIAIEEGQYGGDNKFETGRKMITQLTTSLPFKQTYNHVPVFIAASQSFNESDPFSVRFQNESTSGISLHLQEENSADMEVEHLSETIGYFAIESPGVFQLGNGEIIGESGIADIDHEYITINLVNTYKNPVVIAGSLSNQDSEPAIVRVRNVEADAFELRLDEWSYQNGIHGHEKVYYFVIEGSVPFDQTASCDAIPAPLLSGNQIIAVDNCDNTVGLEFEEIPNENNCSPDNVITRIWSAVDECGNAFSVSQLITVIDTVAPDFTVPPAVAVGCTVDFDNLLITGDITDETDNCDVDLNATYRDIFNGIFNCDTIFTIQRVWTVTDDCGNATSKTQSIFVQNTGLTLNLKTKLQGALMRTSTGLMRDDLRRNGLLPLEEPYSKLPHFQHVGEGGGETIDSSILDIEGENAVVDWVFIEIRDPIKKDSIVATRSALLQRDGDVVDTDGFSGVRFNILRGGSYNVAIRHRNHLGAMSSITSVFTPSTPTVVNLSDTTNQVFGVGSRFNSHYGAALWAGDLNGDRRAIYQGPKNDIWDILMDVMNAPGNENYFPNYIYSAYEATDFDMDGKIIYQGPNNDRAKLIFETILRSPQNVYRIPNFIIMEQLP